MQGAPARADGGASFGAAFPYLLTFAGLAALALPAFADFAAGAWRRPENGHAPFIVAIIVAAIVSRFAGGPHARALLDTQAPSRAMLAAGAACLAVALAAYGIGRVREADLLTSAALPLAFAGALALVGGRAALAAFWFPLAMSLYLVVIPGWAIGAATAPLKQAISEIVAGALYAAGLPVTHAGAVISAGPYQLLVAEACSGVNSIIALTSVGAAYLYVARKGEPRVALAVGLLMLPIAIAANVVRVAALVLITYFLGYDAGQGFLHDGAGLVMFAAALALVFAFDGLFARMFSRRAS